MENKNTPDMTGWTGAEIEQMVVNAAMLDVDLQEAAAFVCFIIKVDKEKIEALRKEAQGRWKFASSRDGEEVTEGRRVVKASSKDTIKKRRTGK